jgi:hypothetical protein
LQPGTQNASLDVPARPQEGASVSSPKPHIKPKPEPYRQQSESPVRDPPSFPERDPPVFTERDADENDKADENVIFREDDCLG